MAEIQIEKFKPEDLLGIILGEKIWMMCQVLKSVDEEYKDIIKAGLSRLIDISFYLGIFFGAVLGSLISSLVLRIWFL